jgi:MFS family permease
MTYKKSRPNARALLMEKKPGKKQLLLVVLSVASLVFAARAVSPALADIAKAFPDKSRETIQMILTVPPLLTTISTLICGYLSRYLGKKTLVILGMILFGIGGITPAFFGDLGFLFVMMGIFGMGSGFLVPLSQSLMADYFEGHEREEFMGYRSATASVFGMLFALLGGSLCAIHWQFTFLSFLMVVPMLAFVIWKMPEPEIKSTGTMNTLAASLTGKMWLCIAGYFLYNVIGISVGTNAAFVMSSCGIGTRTIGIIMAISSGGSIIAGLLLGCVTRLLRDRTLAAAMAFLATGFILLNFVRTPAAFVLASATYSFGFGIFTPTMILKIISCVPRHAAILALSIASCSMGVGQFASPHTLSFVNRLLGLEGARASWVVGAFCFSAAFVALGAATVFLPRKVAEPSSVQN